MRLGWSARPRSSDSRATVMRGDRAAQLRQLVHELRGGRFRSSEQLRRGFMVLVSLPAVAAVVMVTLVTRPEMPRSSQSAAAPASHPVSVGARHGRSVPLTTVRRSTSRTVPRSGSARVLGSTHTVMAGATPEFASAPQARPAVVPLATGLDAVFKRAQLVDQFSGTALVSVRGQVVFQRGYGFVRGHVPIQANTAIPIRRLTTMFTAVAIMQLQDRHRLSVTDRMCRYLPGCPRVLQSITIAQLLTNTSGVRAPRLDLTKPFGEAKMMAAFGSTTPLFKPGTRWKQSDTGYLLLGFIIQKLSGLSYQRYIHDRILAPLGMKTSGFVVDSHHPPLIQGFHGTVAAVGPPRPAYMPVWGMYSTVSDLERFDRALDLHTLLSPAALNAMFGRRVTFIGGGGFGYGWAIAAFHGQPFASVNAGNAPGYVGINLRVLGRPTEIIILSNQDRTNLLALVTSVANQLAKKR